MAITVQRQSRQCSLPTHRAVLLHYTNPTISAVTQRALYKEASQSPQLIVNIIRKEEDILLLIAALNLATENKLLLKEQEFS